MAHRSGTAFIDVTPSFLGFNKKSEAFVRTLKPVKIPTVFDDPKGTVAAPRKPVRVPVELDDGKFQRDIKSKLEAAIKALPKAQIGASTSEAEQKLKDLRAELVTLSDQRIGIDISEGDALAKIRELQVEAEKLGASSPTIQARVDAAGAAAELAGLSAMVDDLGRKSPTVRVDADTTAARAQIAALSGGSVLVKVALAASPLAAPVGAGLIGGLGGLSVLGAGVGAGLLGAAAIGGAVIKQATDAQKKLTQATTQQASAAAAARSANQSLAAAQTAAATAEISGARAITSAQQSLADARRNQGRVAEQSAQQVAAAQARQADAVLREADAERRVRDSLDALHKAREQAKRDLEDLRNQTIDSGNSVADAQIAIQEAQQRVAQLQVSGTTNVLDYTKAQQDAAEAQQRLTEAQVQHQRDLKDLGAADQAGVNGSSVVKSAQERMNEAIQQKTHAEKAVAEAQTALAQARKAASEARADAARSVGRAEVAVAQARADAARTQAQAQGQVADAAEKAAVAQQALTAATAAQQKVLESITPAQQRALAAIASLKGAWHGFLLDIDKPLGGAIVSAAGMLEAALGPLAVFIRPVARSLSEIFDLMAGDAASKGSKRFAGTLGLFSGRVLHDAYEGTKNLAVGFGNLFTAFMPLGTDMSGGLVVLTARFAAWSSTVKDSDGFHSFIDYVNENGPVLLHVLGQTGELLVAVAVAAAPLGEELLKDTLIVLQWTTAFVKAHPTIAKVIIGVIAFVAAASTIAGIIAPVVAAGIAIGGMGILAVGAIVAIDTGLVVLWHKSETFRDIVTGAWTVVKTVIVAAADDIHGRLTLVRDGFGLISKGADALPTALKGTVKALAGVWDGIRAAFADPVDWVIKHVLNKLIDGINGLAEKLGGHKIFDRISPLISPAAAGGAGLAFTGDKTGKPGRGGYASGGVLPGFTPGRDVHHFFSPTGGGLDMSGGEAIMVPEWTRQVGGPLAVARMNKAARAGGKAYAGGGVYRPVKVGTPGAIHDVSTGFPAVDVAVPIGTPVASVAAGRVTKSMDIRGYEPRRPGAQDGYRSYGRVIQVLHDGFSTLYAHLSARGVGVGDLVGGGQLIGRSGNTGNSTGPHLHFGAQGRSPLSFFNGGTNYTGVVGTGTASGVTGSLGFLTGLGSGNVPGGAFGKMLATGTASVLGGMVRSFATRAAKGAVTAPMHGAEGLANGVASLFDSGGYLPPGLSMVYNGTRRPEPVFTQQQAAGLARLAQAGTAGTGSSVFYLVDADGQLIGRMRGEAQNVMDGVGAQASRRGAWA